MAEQQQQHLFRMCFQIAIVLNWRANNSSTLIAFRKIYQWKCTFHYNFVPFALFVAATEKKHAHTRTLDGKKLLQQA